MRLSRMLRWLVLVALLVPAAGFARSFAAPAPTPILLPGRQVVLRAGTTVSQVHIPRSRSSRASIQTATISVNYVGSWDANAKAAFQFAVDIWQTEISSPVPVSIDAHWVALGQGILGAAGPNNFINGFQNQPVANTFYPIALANELAGIDLDPGVADIDAQFNSNFAGWYFGTDGNTPSNKYDFATTVLHELTHGLGFIGSMDVSGGQGSWGTSNPGGVLPFIFDRFAVNRSGQLLISAFPNNSAALAAQLTSNNIFFAGALSTAAAGGTPPKLYTPSPWSEGSSYSHLDDDTYPPGTPNALMTFQINPGESLHDPGSIPLCMFADMGWTTTCTSGVPLTATAVNAITATSIAATSIAATAAGAGTATAIAATATASSEQERRAKAYLPAVIVPAGTNAQSEANLASNSTPPTRTPTATRIER